MAEGLTVRDRRRRALSLRITVPISEELSEAIDVEVEAQVEALPIEEADARRLVTRVSVMREAIEIGLAELRGRRA